MRKKSVYRKAAAILVAGAMAAAPVSGGTEAGAASAKPKKITVTGVKTLYVNGTAKQKTTTLKVKVKPAKASQKVVYSSSKRKVATVASSGKVTAKGVGTAKITVKSKANSKVKKTVTIRVKKLKEEQTAETPSAAPTETSGAAPTETSGAAPTETSGAAPTDAPSAAPTDAPTEPPVGAESVVMKYSSMSLSLRGDGEPSEMELAVKVSPEGSQAAGLTWTSDNEAVATVDENGKVTGHKRGVAVITLTTKTGGTSSCTITVKPNSLAIHDPSVYRDPVGGAYYTFGSHLVAGQSRDLVGWSWLGDCSSGYSAGNGLFTKNYKEEFAEVYSYTMPNGANENAWAPDIIYNKDMNQYCMYISIVDGSKKCCIAMASSDKPEGPYAYQGMIVCSGITVADAGTSTDIGKTNVAEALGITEKEAEDSKYATLGNNSPDCIDATVFYDHNGNLWMVYGSFTTAGGIRLLKLDKNTGLRGENYVDSGDGTEDTLSTDDPYYGKKIANNNGEGPFIQEIADGSSPTGYYYYLWTSVGGLQSYGGYNMRLVRATDVEGPYEDPKGGAALSDLGRAELGLRVIDNYKFSFMKNAFTSCGGNSATEGDGGKTFIHFHQKYANGSEGFVIRTHQTFLNQDGWLVTAPFEYNGETIADSYDKKDVAGRYEFIYHRTTFVKTQTDNYDYVSSVPLTLEEDGTVSGAYGGTWTLDGHYITININNQEYKGVVLEQSEQTDTCDNTMVFTAVGSDNRTLWGSKMHKTDAEAAAYDADQIVVKDVFEEDEELVTEGLFGSEITWSSDNEAVQIEGGKAVITRAAEDVGVELTATVKRGGAVEVRTFDVIVKEISLTISTVVRSGHIDLPAEVSGLEIVWTSSDESVIDSGGNVNQPQTGTKTVTLTARIGTVERVFEVLVLPSEISEVLYEQDYTGVGIDQAGWESANAPEALTVENDDERGEHLQFAPAPNHNSRGAVTDFGVAGKTTEAYTVEFDLFLQAGDNQTTEFALSGSDMAYIDGNMNNGIASGYIFKMSATNSTLWSVNGSPEVEVPAGWVHVLAVVDPVGKTVTVKISDDEETYYEGASEVSGSGELKGMYVRAGRYHPVFKTDNIKVYR